MYQFVLIIHIFAAVSLIGLVLMQQGKGATIGASFGSGASQTVFGSRGSGSFLLRVTIGFVVVFFSTSIALNYIASQSVRQEAQLMLPSQATKIPSPPPVSPSSIPASTPATPAQIPSSKR